MGALTAFVHFGESFNRVIGKATAWLVVAVVLVCFAVVVLRYGFGTGDIKLQEMYVWLHAVVFMIGAGYTLVDDGHVRVDLFYGTMTTRKRAWVNLGGTVFFLLPWLVVILVFGWPYVSSSWGILEPSAEPAGLPGYFLLKSVIFAFCGLMGVQALVIVARCILVLRGREEYAFGGGAH